MGRLETSFRFGVCGQCVHSVHVQVCVGVCVCICMCACICTNMCALYVCAECVHEHYMCVCVCVRVCLRSGRKHLEDSDLSDSRAVHQLLYNPVCGCWAAWASHTLCVNTSREPLFAPRSAQTAHSPGPPSLSPSPSDL